MTIACSKFKLHYFYCAQPKWSVLLGCTIVYKAKKKKKKKKKKKRKAPVYSQTCELRPPKGLGICGRISQVVSFARLGSKNLNRVVHHGTYRAPARAIVISDRSFQHACGGVIGNNNASGACKRDDRPSGVPLREKLDDRKSVFSSIWRMWSLFPGWFEALGRPPVSAIRISQVVAFSRTHSVHLNPQIEGTENACPQYSGGRFSQVVARTGSTVLAYTWKQMRKKTRGN